MDTTALTSGLAVLLEVLATAVNIYLFVLFVRVLLSWFPNMAGNPVVGGVASITDPYLNIFRGVIPRSVASTSLRFSHSSPSTSCKAC